MSDPKYALVKNGVVQTVTRWDGVVALPAGLTPVQVADDSQVAAGWTYDGSSFAFAQTVDQGKAVNRQTIMDGISSALTRLHQIQSQATTFQAQGPYAAANLAAALVALNDLLTKCQSLSAAISDEATYLIGIARILSDQLDGVN